jgi:hypothetical protein
MPRRSAQLALPIPKFEPTEELLRKAHQQSRIKQTFEEAMQQTSFRICLRHMAMLMAGRRKRK